MKSAFRYRHLQQSLDHIEAMAIPDTTTPCICTMTIIKTPIAMGGEEE